MLKELKELLTELESKPDSQVSVSKVLTRTFPWPHYDGAAAAPDLQFKSISKTQMFEAWAADSQRN